MALNYVKGDTAPQLKLACQSTVHVKNHKNSGSWCF
jgi:hypothetical protein